MTLFRNKQNGMLYTLALVRRPRHTEAPRLEATPYRHSVAVNTPVREDFVPVAHC